MLTKEESKHLQKMLIYFNKNCRWKYEKGAIEHNHNLMGLSALSLVDEALNEAIDQVVYLYRLKVILTKES